MCPNCAEYLGWIGLSAIVGIAAGAIITVVVALVSAGIRGPSLGFATTILGGLMPAIAVAVLITICYTGAGLVIWGAPSKGGNGMPDWLGTAAIVIVALSTAITAMVMGGRLAQRHPAPRHGGNSCFGGQPVS